MIMKKSITVTIDLPCFLSISKQKTAEFASDAFQVSIRRVKVKGAANRTYGQINPHGVY